MLRVEPSVGLEPRDDDTESCTFNRLSHPVSPRRYLLRAFQGPDFFFLTKYCDHVRNLLSCQRCERELVPVVRETVVC